MQTKAPNFIVISSNSSMFKAVDGFVRSKTNPGALINTDNRALEAYRLQKQRNREINNTIKDMETVKQDMAEIKALLKELLGKNNDN
jgi:DNA-binding transcriptional regulator YhcF (GntR family)